jgi:hypothetical protein
MNRQIHGLPVSFFCGYANYSMGEINNIVVKILLTYLDDIVTFLCPTGKLLIKKLYT